MFVRKKILGILVCIAMVVGSSTVCAAQKTVILNVPVINQHPQLPTGCEATALTMVLQYYGVNISKEQVARDMPKASRPVVRNGTLYGEHPENAFIGNPFLTTGFGVYAPVILELIEKYLPNRGEDLSGGGFEAVYGALDEGRPVILWCTIGMEEPRENSRWITPQGETFVWTVPEHALVAVGYDATYIYTNDPYLGAIKAYKRDVLELRWEQMGRQALAIKPTGSYEKEDYMTERRHGVIDGIYYTDLVAVDEEGEWLPLRVLEGISSQISIVYDEVLKSTTLKINGLDAIQKEGFSDTIQLDFIEANDGTYTLKIPIDKEKGVVVTYNKNETVILLRYKVVEGTTYISKDWVESFFDFEIESIKKTPS